MSNEMDKISHRALQFAIKSIMYKRQSVKEMRERLEERYPEADQEHIIVRLIELEYLDDQAFCEAYIRHRSLSAPRGKYLLKQELYKKGIQSDMISLCLESFEEVSVIYDLAHKKWEKLHRSPLKKRKTQLMRFLASRGFNISEVINTVNAIAQEPEE
jgi:regulatory protein